MVPKEVREAALVLLAYAKCTQKQISEIVGVDPSTISTWVRPKPIRSHRHLLKIDQSDTIINGGNKFETLEYDNFEKLFFDFLAQKLKNNNQKTINLKSRVILTNITKFLSSPEIIDIFQLRSTASSFLI